MTSGLALECLTPCFAGGSEWRFKLFIFYSSALCFRNLFSGPFLLFGRVPSRVPVLRLVAVLLKVVEVYEGYF